MLLKSVSIAGSVLLLSLMVTGCAKQPKIEYSTYTPVKKSAINANDIIKVNGGRLQFKGKTIMDEDGDINMAFNLDGKLYYFTSKEGASLGTYILKDENSKEIKKFEGKLVKLLKAEDGFPLILVQKDGGKMNQMFDNVYRFDGKEVKLVNKNLQMYNNEFYASGHQIVPKMNQEGAFNNSYFPLVSVVDGSSKTIKALHPGALFAAPNPETVTIITSSGENIIYTYRDINGDYAIEAFSLKSGEAKTLAKGDVVCQLLYSGDKRILRVLTAGQNVRAESSMTGIPVSKYDNEPSTFIDLSSLDEVTVNINDFNKLVLASGFQNMGGGYTRENYVTFGLWKLKQTGDNNRGRPLL